MGLQQTITTLLLVSDPAHREADQKLVADNVLSKIIPKSGQRYEDFNASTDKMSKLGLTALIVGGAGLVAKKVGSCSQSPRAVAGDG